MKRKTKTTGTRSRSQTPRLEKRLEELESQLRILREREVAQEELLARQASNAERKLKWWQVVLTLAFTAVNTAFTIFFKH